MAEDAFAEPTEVIDLLEAKADASGAAFLAVSTEGRILSHDDRLAALLNVPPSVFESRSVDELVAWLVANADDAGESVAALLAGEDPPAAGGISSSTGRAFQFRCVPIRGGHGRVWAFHDASERRHLETGLRDAGYLLRILESHADGIVLELDSDTCIVGIWAMNETYFEEPDWKLQGRRIVDVVGGAQGATFESSVRAVFAKKAPRLFEYTIELRGQRRVFAADARLMPSTEDEAPRVTVMIRDITERTSLQLQLLEAERLASVGLLAAGVAHEVNNPLAYTLLNLERIQRGLRQLVKEAPSDLVDDLLAGAALSLEGGRRVQAIVNDLRRFSRSDHGEPNLPVDVRRVLDFAIEMASHEIRDRARVVRDFREVPFVLASENRLSQIFLNLIVNAAQSIAEGAPEENEIRVVTSTDARGRAVIEVYDTGEGMSASVMQHIFEPFYTTKPALGTGLGLAICHGIVTSLGGKLAVESERGRGSVFRLSLPSAEAHAGE